MNLFNIVAQRNVLLAEIEEAEGELSDELLERLSISDDRIQEGTLFLLGLRETALTNIVGAKAEVQRLQEFIKSNERAVERFDTTLKAAVARFGVINAGTYRVGTKPSVSVVLVPDFRVGDNYGKWVAPVEGYYAPDKTLIRQALQKGVEIEGASLENRTNLSIK